MTRSPAVLRLIALGVALAAAAGGSVALASARRAVSSWPPPLTAGARPGAGPRTAVSEPVAGPALAVRLDAPTAVAPGGTLTVTARLSSRGAVSAPLGLTLTLPTTLTVLGATPPFTTAPGGVVWRLPAATDATTTTRAVTLRVPAGAVAGRDLVLAAAAAAEGAAADVATASRRVAVRASDLRAEIATPARDARPGEPITWTVALANVSAAAAEGLVAAVQLDPWTRYVTDSLRLAAGADGVVRWPLAALPGPGVRYLDVVAAVRDDAPVGAPLAPRVSVTATTGVTRTHDDAMTAAPVAVVVPDLWLTALGPLAAARSGAVSWQLRWGNRGGGRAAGVVVTATLPAGTTVVSTTPPATVVGRGLRWERGDADPEGEAPIEIVRIDATVSPLALDDPLTLRAGVASRGRDADPSDNVARAASALRPGPPHFLDVTAPRTLGVGASAMVVARVADATGAPLDGVTVRFGGAGLAVDPPTVATVRGVATATLTGGGSPGDGRVDAFVDALTASADVAVVGPDLRLTSTLAGPRGRVDVAQVHPGAPLTWTLVVDSGAAASRAVELVTRLPDRLALEAAAASRPITPLGEAQQIGESVERAWRVGDLAAGERVSVTLRPRIARAADWTGADLLFARAELTTTSPVGSVRDLVRNEQLRVYAADLRVNVRLDSSTSSLRPGGLAAFEITFSNGQPQTEIVGAVLTSTLPAGTRFDHWQADVGTGVAPRAPFTADSRQLGWTIEQSLASPGSLRLWLAIDPDARPASELVHLVQIASPVPDLDAGNDARTASAYVAGVDLRTTIRGPSDVAPGESVRYELEVRNAAPQDGATQVTLAAVVPSALEIVSVDDPGQVTGPGRLRWDFEQVGPGSRRTVGFDARVAADAPLGAPLELVAEALAAEGEASPDDNAAHWRAVVGPGAAAAVEVSAAASEVLGCDVGATTVTAQARDAAGRPVADGTPIRWQTTAGRLVDAAIATAGGAATATLRGAPPLGAAVVSARVGAATGQTTVAFVVGPPAAVAVAVQPDRVAAGGAVDVAAQVLDGCGQAVADGWPIDFQADRGTFEGGGSTVRVETRAGAARTRLHVGTRAGALRLSAGHGAAAGEAVVDVVPPTATPPPARHRIWLPFAVRPRPSAPPSR